MTTTAKFNPETRKTLVKALAEILETKATYLGMPSAAYQIGPYHLAKDGALTGPKLFGLLSALHERGFDPEAPETPAEPDEIATEPVVEAEAPAEPDLRTYKAELSDPGCPDRMEVFSAEDDEDAVIRESESCVNECERQFTQQFTGQAREFCEGEVVLLELDELDGNYDVIRGVDLAQYPNGLAIEVPLTGFDPAKLDNLCKMVAGKEALIKMALGVDALPIRVLEDRISFPWFPFTKDGDTVLAYSQLITAICRTALEKTRVNAQPREDYPNPRFTARCWCISLGLVGDEFRLIRKIMTSTLSGNGAFSRGFDPRKVAAQAEAPAGEPAAIETEPAGEADLPGGEEAEAND